MAEWLESLTENHLRLTAVCSNFVCHFEFFHMKKISIQLLGRRWFYSGYPIAIGMMHKGVPDVFLYQCKAGNSPCDLNSVGATYHLTPPKELTENYGIFYISNSVQIIIKYILKQIEKQSCMTAFFLVTETSQTSKTVALPI